MSPVQQTDSEASTFSDDDLDEKALFQLSWLDVLARLFVDVKQVKEPEVSPYPIANINYSSAFDLAMGYYRALRPTMTSLYSSKPFSPSIQTSLSAIGGPASCAKWMLLLSFTMRQCIAHYTIWKDRRDFVLCPAMFQWATQEQIHSIDFNQPLNHQNSQDELAELAEMTKSEKILQLKYEDLVRQWLPQHEDLVAPKHKDSKGVEYCFSLWRAVRWELQTIGCFSRLYHKNFQVWHHRKELLNHVLKTMNTNDARFSSVMATAVNFDDYLLDEHGMSFADIDERVACEAVLFHKDAKNYHIWLHRSWFISAFPFLINLPEGWDKWRIFLGMFPEIKSHDVITNTTAADFSVDPLWKEINCRRLLLPSCPLADEITFTSLMIQEDHFNNSAWCHRFLIIRKYLVEALLRQHHAQQRHADLVILKDVISAVCQLEVDFGLQWAIVEPTNECAFVYARSMAELHQTAILRLLLFERADEDAVDSSTCADSFLLSDLMPPLASVCVQEGLSEDSFHEDDTECEPPRTLEGTDSPLNGKPRKFHYQISNFAYRVRKLSWNEYLNTFALVFFQNGVLRTYGVPRVRELQHAFEQASLEHAPSPPSYGAAVDKEEVGSVRAAMYTNSSQFMLDNMWQVLAAQYHSAFNFLEQTWLLYGDSAFKVSVEQTRRPEDYVVRGVTPDMRTPSLAKGKESTVVSTTADAEALNNNNSNPKEKKPLPAVSLFLTVEADALYLAKRLLLEDPIRSKYWKNEVWTVLYRQY
ncbi:unnamed protein product [Phytomonas sp. Hart1]|nr:unnamed protein product [Phytomonas sp. Hart1]|eukprot:CCW67323.1 unnamed protein product [Phytomonas sp. isolate Hart1]